MNKRPMIYNKIDDDLSSYLDLLRIVAAISVLLDHCVQDRLYDRSLFLSEFSHEGVMIFFVISGLVIANAASKPRESLATYLAARAARIYSVAIPAVFLCYVISGISVAASGGSVWSAWNEGTHYGIFTGILAIVFLLQSWDISADLPWNAPYWSLCYEVWYYIVFGLWLFSRGWKRWLTATTALLVAGPQIAVLFPIWILGAFLSQVKFRRMPSPIIGLSVILTTWALIVFANQTDVGFRLQHYLSAILPGMWHLGSSQRFITDYAVGMLIFMNILGFSMLPEAATRIFTLFGGPIRVSAGYTFSLYLYHRPLTKMLSTMIKENDSILLLLVCLIAIIVVIIILSIFTEQKKNVVRRFLLRFLSQQQQTKAAPRLDMVG